MPTKNSSSWFFSFGVEKLFFIFEWLWHNSQPYVVDTIMGAPLPNNVPKLRSFLGFISYYRSSQPNISEVLACSEQIN